MVTNVQLLFQISVRRMSFYVSITKKGFNIFLKSPDILPCLHNHSLFMHNVCGRACVRAGMCASMHACMPPCINCHFVAVICCSEDAKQAYDKANMETMGDSIKQYLVRLYNVHHMLILR